MLHLKLTEDDEVIIDSDVRFIAACINIDKETSSDIEYGMCNGVELAAMCTKLLMMIEDAFEEEPAVKAMVSELMEKNHDELRRIWKEDHKQ